MKQFSGHRIKTAQSLGISIRTLGMWLKSWKEQGIAMEHYKYIRARNDVMFGFTPNEFVIRAGAIGELEGDSYLFKSIDVEPSSVAPLMKVSVADIHEKHTYFEEVDEVAVAGNTKASPLVRIPLDHVAVRSYAWQDQIGRPHKIEFVNPRAVFCSRNGSTHRVEEESGGITFVPAPGFFGCVVKQKPKEGRPALVA